MPESPFFFFFRAKDRVRLFGTGPVFSVRYVRTYQIEIEIEMYLFIY